MKKKYFKKRDVLDIILMAFGEGKAEIIKQTVEGRPSISVPA